jgi:predicted DsbA family dithiol-disulfide isomerase
MVGLPTLQVDVWSDVACPWCYVGMLRYNKAVKNVSNRASVTTKFHSYMIDPATNSAGSTPLIYDHLGTSRGNTFASSVLQIAIVTISGLSLLKYSLAAPH